MKRGLPADMQALLLVGLNRFDATWHWSDGLESSLTAFTKRGGRLLLDTESVVPQGLSGTSTGMQVMAYAQQGAAQGPGAQPGGCKVAQLAERNRDNAAKLKAAMPEAKRLAVSSDALAWAVPHRTGDVRYVTLTNWNYEPGKPAVRTFKPMHTALTWSATGPIYDLGTGRKLSAAEAADGDLSTDAMRLYACPPADPEQVQVQAAFGSDGVATATITVTGNGKPMAGIPLEIKVHGPAGEVLVHGATGGAVRLPLTRSNTAGTYTIAISELLSGKTATATLVVGAAKTTDPTAGSVAAVDSEGLKRFLARTKIPLVIGLTKDQLADAPTKALAETLVQRLAKLGRKAEIRGISPEELIVGLQTYSAAQRFPQWQTIPADLVLLGDLKSNVLMYDQALGDIYTPEVYRLQAGQALVRMTYSPFIGSYNCLNLFGASVTELTKAVELIR